MEGYYNTVFHGAIRSFQKNFFSTFNRNRIAKFPKIKIKKIKVYTVKWLYIFKIL